MCNRYVLSREHLAGLLQRLGIALEAAAPPATRFNIPPGTAIAAVRQAPASLKPEYALLRWGLVPSWARDAAAGPSNARAESLEEKPTFRDAFRQRRCVVPASGFYEWQRTGGAPAPWYFERVDGAPLLLAGLWESWRRPDGSALETCAIITTAANALMAPLHPRMPAILPDEAACTAWLEQPATAAGDASAVTARLHRWLQPAPAGVLSARRVSPRVNSVRHDDAACLAPPPAEPLDPPVSTPAAQLGFDF